MDNYLIFIVVCWASYMVISMWKFRPLTMDEPSTKKHSAFVGGSISEMREKHIALDEEYKEYELMREMFIGLLKHGNHDSKTLSDLKINLESVELVLEKISEKRNFYEN